MDEKEGLSERDAALSEEALTAKERDGLSLRKAFDQVYMSVDTYYRRKDQFPNRIAEIQRYALAQAREERAERNRQFLSAQAASSQRLRQTAREMLSDVIPVVKEIAAGTYRREEDGKVVRVYPRDMLKAAQFLHRLCEDGILTPQELAQPVMTDYGEPSYRPIGLPPKLDFRNASRVTAIAPDGTEIVVRRGDTFEVEEE